MKAGTDNTRQLGILILLVLVALFTTTRWLRGTPATKSASAVSPAPARPATQVVRPSRTNRPAEGVNNLDPTLRFDLLKNSEQREYVSSGRNIFEPHSQEPPPQPLCNGTAKDCGKVAAVPAQPVYTGPPPIDLKFFGFASSPGTAKKIFLASGDDVFIAGEGEIVNRRYRVVRIQANSVEIEDVLNNNKQTIPLSQG
jgi:hypothetical protein